MRRGLVAVVAMLLAGCAATPAVQQSSAPTSTAVAPTTPSAASKLIVTVPALPDVETSSAVSEQPSDVSSTAAGEPTPSPATEVPASDIDQSSAETGPSVDPQTSAPVAPPPAEPAPTAPTAPGTIGVQLANCPECTVIATATGVAGGLSAALIGQGDRGLLLSLDGSGAVRGASNVPYGTVFPSPVDGHLACGSDARCVVTASLPDGRAVLSAFQLGDDGRWTDLSGSSGFVSATGRGSAVPLEGGYAPAIQVSDGGTTVWAVLGWNGSSYQVVGCTPDADAPDLGSVALDSCLS